MKSAHIVPESNGNKTSTHIGVILVHLEGRRLLRIISDHKRHPTELYCSIIVNPCGTARAISAPYYILLAIQSRIFDNKFVRNENGQSLHKCLESSGKLRQVPDDLLQIRIFSLCVSSELGLCPPNSEFLSCLKQWRCPTLTSTGELRHQSHSNAEVLVSQGTRATALHKYW